MLGAGSGVFSDQSGSSVSLQWLEKDRQISVEMKSGPAGFTGNWSQPLEVKSCPQAIKSTC